MDKTVAKSERYKDAGQSTTTSVENKKRTEIPVKVKEKVVAFFIGGAGDKESYYMSGPYHNIRDALQVLDESIFDLIKRQLYEAVYLSYAEARGAEDVKNNVISRIPSKKSPVLIVGHSLGGWNGAHLSSALSSSGYDVEMLITLDPVGEGALVYIGSDIYRKPPTPLAKFWINIRAEPKKPDASDAVAEFGERWVVKAGPQLNYVADVNHYNAKRMFLAPLKDGKSAAVLMNQLIRKLML
jgi:pimeloyl-ACP methyl ester carboxylesterase